MESRNIGPLLALMGILLITEWIRVVQSVSTEEDLTLTRKEKEALDKVEHGAKLFSFFADFQVV